MNITIRLAAIALMIILSGCVGDNPDKLAKNAMNRSDAAICEKISDYRMRYNCSMTVAVSQDNTTMCDAIESEEWKNDCLGHIAAKRRNITICTAIESDSQKDECYRKVAAG
jgi:hypothetical protein